MRGMIIIQFNDFAYLAEGEHYMNEKQYLRANKRVFLAVTIIFAYITPVSYTHLDVYKRQE